MDGARVSHVGGGGAWESMGEGHVMWRMEGKGSRGVAEERMCRTRAVQGKDTWNMGKWHKGRDMWSKGSTLQRGAQGMGLVVLGEHREGMHRMRGSWGKGYVKQGERDGVERGEQESRCRKSAHSAGGVWGEDYIMQGMGHRERACGARGEQGKGCAEQGQCRERDMEEVDKWKKWSIV